jgi:hypothetical protein
LMMPVSWWWQLVDDATLLMMPIGWWCLSVDEVGQQRSVDDANWLMIWSIDDASLLIMPVGCWSWLVKDDVQLMMLDSWWSW